jgi:selenocysteine lyase/cysteine desulfurase
MTYLNTAAEGIPPLCVGEALHRYFRDKQLGSPGRAQHMEQWDAARGLAASMLGLRTDEVGICSNSSEAFNLLALALRLQPGDEVVVNDLDFPAGVTRWLQAGCGAEVRRWRAREGALHVEDLVRLLGPRTRLVTTSLVSYFNGFLVPVAEVIQAVRRYSPALLALDVTQAMGRIPLQLDGVDFVVSSTHKWIMATHGGGIVGIPQARAAELTAPAGGWFHLQNVFEGDPLGPAVSKPGAASFMTGMPVFPAIYAIRAALQYVQEIGVDTIHRAAQPLVEQCLEGLRRLPIEIITPQGGESLAGILAFRHPRMDALHAALQEQRVHLMCSAGRMRVAIHGYNSQTDVERLLDVLEGAL